MNFFRKKIAIPIGIGVILLAAFFLAKPIYREFKEWRARQLSAQAIAIFEEDEDRAEAWEKARAAYNLAPHVLEVVRAVARIYSETDPYKSLPFWKESVKLSNGARDDRIGLAKAALATGLLELVEEQLSFFSQELKTDSGLLYLKARLLASQNKVHESIEAARQLVTHEVIPEDAHFFMSSSLNYRLNPMCDVKVYNTCGNWLSDRMHWDYRRYAICHVLPISSQAICRKSLICWNYIPMRAWKKSCFDLN